MIYRLDNYENCHSTFTIEKLKQYLKDYALHDMFEGKHITPHGCCDAVEFFGNFASVSFVFRFSTKDKELIKELKELIESNLNSKGYRDFASIKPTFFKSVRILGDL